MIIFDIDGVLTPKTQSANINLVLTEKEKKDKIANAPAATDGFHMLTNFLWAFVELFHCKTIADSPVWSQVAFLTGRKKAEYYDATKRLFLTHYDNYTTQMALDMVVWYPEQFGYDKETYFTWKIQELQKFDGPVTYVDDDAELVTRINALNLPNIRATHYEAKGGF